MVDFNNIVAVKFTSTDQIINNYIKNIPNLEKQIIL